MQSRAANSVSDSLNETGLGSMMVVDKANAAKRICAGSGKFDSQFAQRGEAVRHNSLAACLIDGRHRAIDQRDSKTLLSGGDGSGQSGWASTGYENFGVIG